MFEQLKLRFARKREARKLAQILLDAGDGLSVQDLRELIRERKVVVMQKKHTPTPKGVFVYATLGICGLISMLFIRKLAIHQRHRGQGLGSVMLGKIKEFTIRKRAIGFLLFALEKAQVFYEKHRLQNFWRFFWWWRA